MSETIEISMLGAVIKQAYEAQANTNPFTDAEKAALASALQVAQRGAAMGVAELDASGMVPVNRINVSGLSFHGAYNPNTNTPALIDGTGTVGQFYKASVAGTRNFGNGSFTFNVGDWVIFAGGTWQRIGVSDSVAMVNGRVGNVVLTAADVGALPAGTVFPSAPVLSVQGKNGDVVLSASDVGARPDTYVPTWAQVTGKPDFPALYQPMHRGSIGPAVPAVLAYKSSNTDTVNLGWTVCVYDSVAYDEFACYNKATGNITVPSWAKHMRVTGLVSFPQSTNGARCAALVDSANAAAAGVGAVRVAPSATSETALTYQTGVFPVVAGAMYRMRTLQTSGGTLAVMGGSTGAPTWIQVELYE